jgi:hypothetical protein
MAKIFPGIETIEKLRPTPTQWELACIKILQENLSDDFEIYFQPYINWDHPDIVVMRKNAGVFIIEVKDWVFSNYDINQSDDWCLKSNNTKLKSPIKQVKKYKDDLYNLHIEGLLEKKIKDGKLFSLIKTGVYFHKESKENINKFIVNKDKYVEVFWYDSVQDIDDSILKDYWENSFFTDELYVKFKRFLQPTFHTKEQWIDINYTNKQKDLSISKWNIQQKIKWVAGSWKTLVLAKRAVNAYKRTNKRVLILTYNITLKNYIHDKISEIREDFSRENFYIDNYHNFMNAQGNNLNKKITNLSDYQDLNLFENVLESISKYDAIFIDEVQDYEPEWIKIIKKYFLADNWEFVVFGDEKQNVYNRHLDENKKPNTTIVWRWSELSESFRLSDKIARLASRFQLEFFAKKYEVENIKVTEQYSLFVNENINYLSFDSNKSISELVQCVWWIIKERNIHSNDVCILSSKTALLRNMDYHIRIFEKTKVSFETEEMYKKVEGKKEDIKEIRRNKKFNFWMNPWVSKLSTTYSFKWRESPTLFLILDSEEESDELIYTAMTRCRDNLFIINIGNKKYENFFKSNTDIVTIMDMDRFVIKKDGLGKSLSSDLTVSDVIKEDLSTLYDREWDNL